MHGTNEPSSDSTRPASGGQGLDRDGSARRRDLGVPPDRQIGARPGDVPPVLRV